MRRLFVILGLLIIFSGMAAHPASANGGLNAGYVGGKGLNPEVLPGESYTQDLLVSIDKSEAPTDVLIEILGYTDGDSGIKPVLPESDTSQYSARSFIQPGRILVHCEPGDAKVTPFAVNIPKDSQAGGRYAVLRFTTAPLAGSNGVATASSIVLPLRFTVSGGPLVHTGEVGALAAGPATSGNPVDVSVSFKNTGNHHYNILGQVEIRDSSGKLVDTLFFNASSPVPQETKKITTTFIPKGELAQGLYSLKSRLTLEDGTLLGEVSGSFEVQAAYVPPPPPAAVSLKPSQAATLKTDDGRVIVDFPQGAVLGEIKLSLRSYSPDQLPAAPPEFKLGTTCFRVDGLTGLLARDATLNVKYSMTDLTRAGGESSRLRLARWDDASNKWIILETKVDKSSMTLTANSNQFSLWAVIIGDPTSSSNWVMYGLAAGIAVLFGAGGFWLMVRKRPKQR